MKIINIGFMGGSWELKKHSNTVIKEAGEPLPTGELGSLAQRGVEELEPETKIKERPLTTHILDIMRAIKNIKGFTSLEKLHSIADGMVAVFEHEDGNAYKVYVKQITEPKVGEI